MNGNGLTSKKVAMVIGSGAVKCAAALGLWKVLRRENIPIDMLVGCSGGSLFAATMALGYDLDECIATTQRLWNRKVTEKRHWPSILKTLLPGVLGFDERFGMVDDTALLKALDEAFGGQTFADARTPLYIQATDFHTAEPVTLTTGRLADALRASIAIPFIWPPWRVDSRLLMDGSLSNPLPIDIAIREGAGLIMAMGFEQAYPRRIKSISRFVFHINSVMTNNLLQANYAFHNLAHHAEIITILPEFEHDVRLFDTGEFPMIIQAGERAAEAQIPYLKRLLAMDIA